MRITYVSQLPTQDCEYEVKWGSYKGFKLRSQCWQPSCQDQRSHWY